MYYYIKNIFDYSNKKIVNNSDDYLNKKISRELDLYVIRDDIIPNNKTKSLENYLSFNEKISQHDM